MLKNKLLSAMGGAPANYIEDVFSTYLYTGNGSTQTITNGIDLAGKGGLVWIKNRTTADGHRWFNTVVGSNNWLSSNTTAGNTFETNALTSFNANGFTLGSSSTANFNTDRYASWTFRKQPKFFDVVTFSTTTGSSVPITVNHNLGSVPGCIIVKQTNGAADWFVYHRSLGSSQYLALNSTDFAQNGGTSKWVATPTATSFTLGNDFVQNATYVAYIFAHNAGGFGLTGTDNVISCGSYTGTGAAGNAINLGYEAQWVMIKRTDSEGYDWNMFDVMRGMPVSGGSSRLSANTSAAEITGTTPIVIPTATGFSLEATTAAFNGSGGNYIYIAIRRGPMKTPTSGTSVFSSDIGNSSGNTNPPEFVSGFPVDSAILRNFRSIAGGATDWYSRLTGGKLPTYTTNAEASGYSYEFAFSNGFYANGKDSDNNVWMLRRAPGFFDEVCYTGNGTSGRTVTHNLGVAPELMIVKDRSDARDWAVYYGNRFTYAILNSDSAPFTTSTIWNDTAPTASVFTVGNNSRVNASNETFVAYLFASCTGVSKIGSYTGTGTTQQINCGFTAGARFVLIKRTDSTGDWYVWDSARGIVAGNDPYLLLNSTAAEVTTTDYVDTFSAGFEISSTAPAAINASGGTFIYLAIA